MKDLKCSAIIQAFIQNVERQPDKAALIVEDKIVSYRELSRQVADFSMQLNHGGVSPGDHVGVLLPNGLAFVVVMLAAARMGLVLVPHNMSLSQAAIRRAFEKADVQHLVIWHALTDELTPVIEHLNRTHGCVIVAGPDFNDGMSYDNKALRQHPFERPEIILNRDLPYILTMTSGSTGDPKPIVLSQLTKYRRALAAADLYGIGSEDIVLAATPLYHSLAERLVLMPLLLGGTSVILTGFSAVKWLQAVMTCRVSFTIAVSSQLKQIIRELKSENYSLSSLRCLVSSSERLDTELKRELCNYLDCEFHECYGTSEIAIATNLTSSEHDKLASVGKPIPGVQIAIIGEQGEWLGVGQKGEIICKTPMLFSGYYRQETNTSAAMHNGYFRTGDLGELDSDGYLYFLGRKKDIIISGGINIYPRDIEELLLTHPDVAECAVIPLADEALGEAVAAVIVPVSEDGQCLKSLQRLCARELADYQQPRQYYFVKELPKNTMGKIAKQELIKRFNTKRVKEFQ